jgi:hypothetical protein
LEKPVHGKHDSSSTKPKAKRAKKTRDDYDPDDLRAAMPRDSKSSNGIYETLKTAGHVTSAIDYLEEEEPSV